MKKVLAGILILLLLVVITVWFFVFRGKKNEGGGPKPAPITVSKHSETFDKSVGAALIAYYSMVEGFINWDTVAVNKNAVELSAALNNLSLDELQKDTAKDAQVLYATAVDFLANAKTETLNITGNPPLDKKREFLNSLSDNLRNLILTVRYDREKVYYQECPMAFDENVPGYWLSPKEEIRNPYMGARHPEHKDGMLTCGNSKGTIIKDSAGK